MESITIEELCESVYEDLNGLIQVVSSEADSYRIRLSCDDWNDYTLRRRFDLICNEVVESTATPSFSSGVEFVDADPILWDHNTEHVSVYFSSRPESPEELLGKLFGVHEQLYRGKRELTRYLHADCKLLRDGYGLLAEGPRNVMDAYSNAIGDQLRLSMVKSRSPSARYRALLFDSCFVVCKKVEVAELREND